MDCCNPGPSQATRAPCPSCGQVGWRVETATVEAISKPGRGADVACAGPRFCPTKACDVLYYGVDGRSILKTEARIRVGLKESDPPIPLCYCFGFSRADIERELAETGVCTLAARITRDVKAGRCACKVKNPAGVCCLREVNREIKDAIGRHDTAAGRDSHR